MRLGLAISSREALFRQDGDRPARFLKRWLHARAPKVSTLAPRVAGGPARSHGQLDRTFPASGRYVYVPKTSIGCSWGTSNGQHLALCQLSSPEAPYAFAVSDQAVTAFYYPAGSKLPQTVYRRAQP